MPDYVSDYIIKKVKSIIAVLICVIIGHMVVIPVIGTLSKSILLRDILLGLAIYMLVRVVEHAISVMKANQESRYAEVKNLPKTKKDIERLGIQNPVDFCIMMQMYFGRCTYNILSSTIYTETENQNVNSWRSAAMLFKSCFGSNLHGWTPMTKSDFSWGLCLEEEAKLMLNRKQDETVTEDEIWSLISPTLKNNLALQRPGGESQ